MSVAWSSQRTTGAAASAAGEHAATPGKRTLTEDLPQIAPVQRKEAAGAAAAGADVHAAAAHGTSEAGTSLPHLDWIQQTFGRHDVRHVRAHVGGAAAEGAGAMGAEAFATGDRVAFARQPDLHTAAHEAAHVVQQRGGVQLKGGVGQADDAHERHADAVADRVVQGKSTEDLLDQVSGQVSGGGDAAGGSGAVQRKITIEPAAGEAVGSEPPARSAKAKGKKRAVEPSVEAAAGPSTSASAVAVKEATEEEVMEFLREHGALSRATAIYHDVLLTKPEALAKDPGLQTFDAAGNAPTLVDDWVSFQAGDSSPYPYRNTAEGAAKLLKDAFKYWLHTAHGWKSVGVAEYMTGDATGLALAPIADEKMTIKVLQGPQKTEPAEGGGRTVTKQGETFLNKPSSDPASASEDPAGRLPEAFATAKQQGQIRFSDAASRDDSKYSGTDELYRRRYNVHDKEDPVKPWNKETHAATSAIGEGLKDPSTAEKLRKPLQLGDTPEGEEARTQVRAYKKKLDATIGGKPCLILWGRTSGRDKPGGAHKELDSHALMIQQLAAELRDKFKDRTLVFVGDDALTREEFQGTQLSNELFYVGKFWNDEEYGPALRGREQQRYLFELFSAENDAISLGMRSGSLEGLALLGMRVIFIDDLGNNAAGRMESWAGTAANGRAEAYAGGDADARAAHEQKHAGPLNHYKRVGTLLQLGNQVDARRDTLTKVREALAPLNGVDAAGAPICNEAGSKPGNELLGNILAKLVALQAVGGKVGAGTADGDRGDGGDGQREAEAKQAAERRKAVDTAYADLAKVPAQLKPDKINYVGTAATAGYRFNAASLQAAIDKLAPLAATDPGAQQAKDHLESLRGLEAHKQPLVHDGEDSPEAKRLLEMANRSADAASKGAGKAKKADKGFAGFNSAFEGQRNRMLGTAIGGVKFRTADVQALNDTLTRLESHNVLQPAELDQVSSLVSQMSGPPPAPVASPDVQHGTAEGPSHAGPGVAQPGTFAPGEWLDIRTSFLRS
ncbi:MAG TPA: DUF4157 domain-containing protein [Kofleriaceae bacterium]